MFKTDHIWPEYEPSTSEEQQGKASLICTPVGPKNCSSYLLYQKKQKQKDHKGFLSRWEQNWSNISKEKTDMGWWFETSANQIVLQRKRSLNMVIKHALMASSSISEGSKEPLWTKGVKKLWTQNRSPRKNTSWVREGEELSLFTFPLQHCHNIL